ncbi:MAG: DNA/RNA-binding protein AlbA [Candidatus Thorarchaeota archaeon]
MSTESILVGTKPIHSYVLACFTKLNENSDKIVLKARGRAISRCVDVAEIISKRYFKDKVKIADIRISTMEANGNNISTIEIDLERIKK